MNEDVFPFKHGIFPSTHATLLEGMYCQKATPSVHMWAMKKPGGCLGYIGDVILPSYVGIIS